MSVKYPGARGGASLPSICLSKSEIELGDYHMLNLLFIDDQSDRIETVRNLIRKEREDIKCEFSIR